MTEPFSAVSGPLAARALDRRRRSAARAGLRRTPRRGFKLSAGTFVSVGPLRAKVLAPGAPLVQDSVVTGLDRDEVGLLLFPRPEACRCLAKLGPGAALPEALRDPTVRAFFQSLVDHLWQAGSGSANRTASALLLVDPPSIDHGEITDKGSINQRAVLHCRAALIDAMYADAEPSMMRPSLQRR